MGTAILTSRSGAAGGSSGGFEVGDILLSSRNDVGDDFLLCNGSNFYSSEYPELSKLFPFKIGDPITASYNRDITIDGIAIDTTYPIMDSFLGYDNKAYWFIRDPQYKTNGLFYLVYTNDFVNYSLIKLNLLDAGYVAGELEYIVSCTVSEAHIAVMCTIAMNGSSATTKTYSGTAGNITISYIEWDNASEIVGTWNHLHPYSFDQYCYSSQEGVLRYAGNGNCFFVASLTSSDDYTCRYGKYSNNFANLVGVNEEYKDVSSADSASIKCPYVIDSDHFAFVLNSDGYYNCSIVMYGISSGGRVGTMYYNNGYPRFFIFNDYIYMVTVSNSSTTSDGCNVYKMTDELKFSNIGSPVANACDWAYTKVFNYNGVPHYVSSGSIYKLTNVAKTISGELVNTRSSSTAAECVDDNNIIKLWNIGAGNFGIYGTLSRVSAINQCTLPAVSVDGSYSYIKAK